MNPLAPETLAIVTLGVKGKQYSVQIDANKSFAIWQARNDCHTPRYKSMRRERGVHGNDRIAVFLLGRPFCMLYRFYTVLSFSILHSPFIRVLVPRSFL